MEARFLRAALFSGMTANAFKLGTVLTCGWFWSRAAGCTALYRGDSMEAIDFASVLVVGPAKAGEMFVPSYLEHENCSTYFYVVRRINNVGSEEHTLAAAVKVSIDANGELAEPQPNNIFEAKARQVGGNKVQLVWYYCPIDQKAEPWLFNVYCDGGTGQVDYENPVAKLTYQGRRFYSYTSGPLEVGRYLFCIRAESAGGTEDDSVAQIMLQVDVASPDRIDILQAEAI